MSLKAGRLNESLGKIIEGVEDLRQEFAGADDELPIYTTPQKGGGGALQVTADMCLPKDDPSQTDEIVIKALYFKVGLARILYIAQTLHEYSVELAAKGKNTVVIP